MSTPPSPPRGTAAPDGTRFAAVRNDPGSWTQRFVAVARRPLEVLARWLFDLQITGREHLPRAGYVIAANHLSFIDPVMVTLAGRRNVRYLAVASLFDAHHLFDRLISFFGAIPTPRDRIPVGALRTALAELDAGNPIGLFPEGRRVTHWREEPPQRGAAWLALASGKPLVPMAMRGTEGTLSLVHGSFRRTPIRIWIEPPIHPDDYLDHVDPVGAMMEAWLEAVGRRMDPWWNGANGAR